MEGVDIAQCRQKKLRRSRRTAITVQYTPLDLWPWGAKQLLTLNGAAAVCAQHAIEDFKHRFSCNSN
jgi:peptide deformylase